MTRGADFQALFQKGQRIDRPSLIVLWRESGSARRVGFAVSRQVRNAVKRNRARRRLREAWRRTRDVAPKEIALVIIGRPTALTADFSDLVVELHGALGGIPGRERTR